MVKINIIVNLLKNWYFCDKNEIYSVRKLICHPVQVEGSEKWTELSASQLLKEYRSQQKLSKGLSFTTIAAFGANSAVIHYTPTEETDANINTTSLFLGIFLQSQCESKGVRLSEWVEMSQIESSRVEKSLNESK